MLRKRSIVAVSLAVILTLAMVMSACSSDKKTTGDSGDKPITIKVNSFLPEANSLSTGTVASVENIEKFSNGELKGEGYYGGTLLSFEDSWEGAGQGTVDVAYIGPAILGQYSRLLDGLQLMYRGRSADEKNTTKAFNDIVKNNPEFDQEMAKHNLKLLYVEGVPGSAIHTVDKTIVKPSDCRGIVIDALGKNNAEYFTSLGATTKTLEFGEYLLSAQRGVVDAFLDGWGSMNDSQAIEALKNHTVFGEATEEHPSGSGISSSPMTYVINLDTWNKLTESQQEALTKAFEEGVALVPAADLVSQQASYNLAVERGDVITSVTGADLEAWIEAAQPVTDAWIAEMDKLGYDGKQLYDNMQATFDKYQ